MYELLGLRCLFKKHDNVPFMEYTEVLHGFAYVASYDNIVKLKTPLEDGVYPLSDKIKREDTPKAKQYNFYCKIKEKYDQQAGMSISLPVNTLVFALKKIKPLTKDEVLFYSVNGICRLAYRDNTVKVEFILGACQETFYRFVSITLLDKLTKLLSQEIVNDDKLQIILYSDIPPVILFLWNENCFYAIGKKDSIIYFSQKNDVLL